jgi:hypothetical protein
MSSKGWYTHWDPSTDLSGGVELSYRNEKIEEVPSKHPTQDSRAKTVE